MSFIGFQLWLTHAIRLLASERKKNEKNMTKFLQDLIDDESSFEIHEIIDLEIKLEGKESKSKKNNPYLMS